MKAAYFMIFLVLVAIWSFVTYNYAGDIYLWLKAYFNHIFSNHTKEDSD